MMIEDEDIPVQLIAVNATSNDGSSKRKNVAAGGAGLSNMFKKETLKRVDSFEEEVFVPAVCFICTNMYVCMCVYS